MITSPARLSSPSCDIVALLVKEREEKGKERERKGDRK
jgi:hypothetical protein